MKYLRLEQDEKTLVIYLNNPPVNALNSALMQELKEVLDRAAKDKSISSLVITGEGKFFSAGADIKEIHALLDKDFLNRIDFISKNGKILNEIEMFPKSVIAAINGHALGGGLELALACHLMFASPNAKLGLPEIDLGIFPGWGGTFRLPKLIGLAKAKKLIMTGKIISAAAAACLGMVDGVVDQNKLLEEIKGLAKVLIDESQDVSKCSLLAMSNEMKQAVDQDEILTSAKELAEILAGKSHDALMCAYLAINSKMNQEEVAVLFAELLGRESARKGINDFLNKKKK